MFQQSPFAGACAASTYEVLVMLAGTFLLGLMLGYLIWGWLRREIVMVQKQAEISDSIARSKQLRIASLTTLAASLKDAIERAETKLSLSEYRLRKFHEENQLLLQEIDTLRSEAGLHGKEVHWEGDDGPTLADISHAMEGQASAAEIAEAEDQHERSPSLGHGTSPESLAIAGEVFGTPVLLNDLKMIKGIGPEIESILHRRGIRSWAELAQCPLPVLREVLREAGEPFPDIDLKTWVIQARMAAKGEWRKLKAFRDTLDDVLPR